MSSSDPYLYRGASGVDIATELRNGAIQGGDRKIYYGTIPEDDIPLNIRGMDLREFPWQDGMWEGTEQITGGVTDSLRQTLRFSGADNFAMVLDGTALPFEPIQYDYEWLDFEPGVFTHMVSTSDGEIRIQQPGDRRQYGQLWGAVDKIPRASGDGETWNIQNWGTGTELPGTTERSGFAREQEYIAHRGEVAVNHAIEGVVSFLVPGDIQRRWAKENETYPDDAPPVEEALPGAYEWLRDKLPAGVSLYVLVTDDTGKSSGGFEPDDLIAAYRDDGAVQPASVPARFRGAA
jgi:hypothetical protein